jgi:intracellular multiplication protein IcmS
MIRKEVGMSNSKQNLPLQVAAVAKELGCKFTLKGAEVDPVEIFAVKGLLPAIMRRADQLCSFCLGYGLGVDFSRADGTMLGVSVNFDDKGPAALRLLCAADVLVEIVQNSPNPQQVALDELMLD